MEKVKSLTRMLFIAIKRLFFFFIASEKVAIKIFIIFFSLFFNPELDAKTAAITEYANIRFLESNSGPKDEKNGGILQDRDGFLWIGTSSGLSRYDGYERKRYTEESGFLSGNWVMSLVEDTDGEIWIGTFNGGVTRYDKKSETWTHYKHNPKDENSLTRNNLPYTNQALFVDKFGILWIGTNGGGLNRFDKKSGKWTHYLHDPNNKNSISDNKVNAIIEGKEQTLWVGTEGGLSAFDRKSSIWTHYTHDSENSISDNNVRTLIEDKYGVLWVGTKYGGLNRFDRKKGTWKHFKMDISNPNSPGSDHIFYIYEDKSEMLWLCHEASDVAGLTVFDKKTETFIRCSPNPKDPFSIKTMSISGIYEDPGTGVFWIINTYDMIQKYDKNSQKFNLLKHNPNNPNSLSGNGVTHVQEDSDGVIWLGVFPGGLNKFNRKTGEIVHYLADLKAPHSLQSNVVSSFLEDSSGTFWVTNPNTLLIFDRATGKVVKRYDHNPNNPDSITKCRNVRFMLQDKEDSNILWLSTHGGGVEKFKINEGTFTHFKHDPDNPDSLCADILRVIYDDGKDRLWFPTFDGLSVLNKTTGRIKNYKHDPNDPDSISSNFLLEAYEDSSGNMWIIGKGGLSKFDRKTENFKNYGKKHGLPSFTYSIILEDNDKYLWLGSLGGGLIKFDPETESVVNKYNESDGLQSMSFWGDSGYKTEDGELWFGGGGGVNFFYPDKIKSNQYIPPIVLTSFTQGGNNVNLGRAPEKLKTIKLDWKFNFFEFQFASLNYTKPEKNQYAYMLEGRDSNWYYSGHQPFGRYTGLQGGTYELRLKGSNNDGVWNEKWTSIKIIVKSPFWKTSWFYFSLIVVFCMGIGFITVYLQKLRSEIAERKHAEKALKESRERVKLALKGADLGMWDCDIPSEEWVYDEHSIKLIGAYPKNDAAFNALIHPDDLKRYHDTWDALEKGREPSFIFEYRMKNPSGQYKWFMKKGKIVEKDNNGTPVRATGTLQDITKRKQTEEETAKMEIQLRQAQKMESIGTLAGGIAHDFNNILFPIIGYTQMLLDDAPTDSPSKPRLDKIYSATMRAKDLVQQILTFARQDNSELKVMKIQFIVKEALKLIRSTIPATIQIIQNIDPECGKIKADPTQIHQIIMNLATNAYHAMEERGGELKVTLQPIEFGKQDVLNLDMVPGTYICLTVADTGIGMHKDLKEKIFDPFFTTKKKGKGTGMGLSVVHGIVKNIGGSISAYSEPGKGTEFHVYFPLEKSSFKKQKKQAQEVIQGGTEQILLVDDDDALLTMEKEMLERLGYQVTSRISSIEALEAFRVNPNKYDLVITDFAMPGMAGDKLAI